MTFDSQSYALIFHSKMYSWQPWGFFFKVFTESSNTLLEDFNQGWTGCSDFPGCATLIAEGVLLRYRFGTFSSHTGQLSVQLCVGNISVSVFYCSAASVRQENSENLWNQRHKVSSVLHHTSFIQSLKGELLIYWNSCMFIFSIQMIESTLRL